MQECRNNGNCQQGDACYAEKMHWNGFMPVMNNQLRRLRCFNL
jgi:hypothetical protein